MECGIEVYLSTRCSLMERKMRYITWHQTTYNQRHPLCLYDWNVSYELSKDDDNQNEKTWDRDRYNYMD